MMELDRTRLDKIRNKLMWMSQHAPSSFANPDIQDLLFLLDIVDRLCPQDLEDILEEEEALQEVELEDDEETD